MTDTRKLDLLGRLKLLAKGIPIETSEISREEFLKRLSKAERQNLFFIIDSINATMRRPYLNMAVLGVGTVTYDNEYWEGLKKYLMQNDPAKMHFVERRGEDIDLVLLSENEDMSNFAYEEVKIIPRIRGIFKLREIKYDYSLSRTEFGPGYLTVPQEFREKEGQSVIRHKRIEYANGNFVVHLPESRPFHFYFDFLYCAIYKINQERAANMPFSVLMRYNDLNDLEKAIADVDKC
jgi:hypothetical protein